MGYCIGYRIYNVQIPAAQAEAALAAINALFAPEQIAQYGTVTYSDHKTGTRYRSYRGATPPHEGDRFPTLADALQAWSFGSTVQPDGSVVIDSFYRDKAGDEWMLFDAIAPFLDRSTPPRIDAYQENLEYWRHCFESGRHRIVPGKIIYGDEHPEVFNEEEWQDVQGENW